jgi:hypothetical protein
MLHEFNLPGEYLDQAQIYECAESEMTKEVSFAWLNIYEWVWHIY